MHGEEKLNWHMHLAYIYTHERKVVFRHSTAVILYNGVVSETVDVLL